jgi:uncharacterized membrane protein
LLRLNRARERGKKRSNKMPTNSTTTCAPADASGTLQCQTEYASSTGIVGGFTYGEVVNSVFGFLTLITLMVACFHLMFRKIKIRN